MIDQQNKQMGADDAAESAAARGSPRSPWRAISSHVLTAVICIAGTAFFEESGKQLFYWCKDVATYLLGSDIIHVRVLDNDHGKNSLSGVLVRYIPDVQNAPAVEAFSDNFGRVDFQNMITGSLRFEAEKITGGAPVRCSISAFVKDLPGVVEILVDSGTKCTQFNLTPVFNSSLNINPSWLSLALGSITRPDENSYNTSIATAMLAAGALIMPSSSNIGPFYGGNEKSSNDTDRPTISRQTENCDSLDQPISISKMSARSFLSNCAAQFQKYGTRLKFPVIGAIGVIGDIDPKSSTAGQVGVVSAVDKDGVTMVVKNRDDSVDKVTYPPGRIDTFVWPPGETPPAGVELAE